MELSALAAVGLAFPGLSSLGRWSAICQSQQKPGAGRPLSSSRGNSQPVTMLATLMTALFFMVKAFRQLGNSLIREEPLPYLVHQPLPWQVQYVTQSRRDSGKAGSSRHNSIYGTPGRKGDSYGAASAEQGDAAEKAPPTI